MLLVAAVPAHAEDDGVLDTLQLHGFLSQALVVTDDNDVFGPSSDGGSLEFTEIGANVSLRPHEDVLIAAQVLSRRAGGERGDAEPKLDYGLIDYQLQSNQQRNVGVQLGRFKNPFGFYNQTRDVAFTRPGILLPQSIYFDRTRSLALSGDGLSVYHEEHLANGTLRSQIGFGRSRVEDDVDRTLGMERLPGAFEPDTSAIGQIRYEHDGGRIITALSAADANAGYDSPGDFPGDGKFQFQPWVFSFQYNQELWSLTAEYAIRQLSLEGFNGIADTQKTGESWYLQYQRRFLDDWQWLVRYDHLVNDRDDPSGNDYAAAGAGPGYSQFAKDWTLGLQWRLTPRVLLSGEYHYIDGTAWLPPQDDLDPSETERYWNMLLFQVALRF
jgi:hypothetical protein